MIVSKDSKEIGWNVIIKNGVYTITFIADPVPVTDGPIKMTHLYCLKRDKFNYALATYENGTYKLFSQRQNGSKLYLKGALNKIRFIPKLYLVSRKVAVQ